MNEIGGPYEFFESDLRRAHKHSSQHFGELLRSGICACFYCFDRFEFKDIKDWTDKGQTALCPGCGIDSVLGDACGFALTDDFLSEMHRFFFGDER